MVTEAQSDFALSVNFDPDVDPSLDAESPRYTHSMGVDNCVTLYDENGEAYDERFYAYGVTIEFSNYDDLNQFLTHPQREEIQNSITRYMQEQGGQDLGLEALRDLTTDVYPDAGPETLTEGTRGDLGVVLDELIPEINKTYGLSITNSEIMERSTEAPFCIPPYLGPNEHAELDIPDGDSGMMGMGMSAGKMGS